MSSRLPAYYVASTKPPAIAPSYDIVALVSNDLVTDQRMQRCLTSLTRDGYACLLLGRERAGSKPLDPSLPFRQERHILTAERGKRFYLQLNRAHRARLIELRPRAILVVDLDTMWAGATAASALGVPWVYDAHELFTEVPEVRARWWIRAAWSLLARRYVRRAAAVYTVGGEIARRLAAEYGLREVGVVRNFPWLAEREPAGELRGEKSDLPPLAAEDVDQQRMIVLYQGALNAGRGLEELVRAAAQLPEVRFWIVGGGYRSDELRALATGLGVPNVRFFGELPPKRLRHITPHASLGYALMQHLGDNYFLSLSNKSIDYIHAGIRSLQMDWPEYRRIAEAYPGVFHLVSELSPTHIASAVHDERSRNTAPRVFAKAKRRLCWESESERLLRIWRSVLPPQIED